MMHMKAFVPVVNSRDVSIGVSIDLVGRRSACASR